MGKTLTTLVFGAVAGLGSIPWAMIASPAFFGRTWALAAYCLIVTVLYLVAVAPSWSRGLVIGGLASLLAAATLVAAPSPSVAVAGAALILAVARSGFLYRGKPARALLIEGVLAFGGLLLASWLAGPSPLGSALAIWTFFLVQSPYFLIGGMADRESEEPVIDPFERARKRALALMEEA